MPQEPCWTGFFTASRYVMNAIGAVLFGLATTSFAATVERFTPQGEVRSIRQVTVRFNEPAIKFGDPAAPEPFTGACVGASVSGKGRWVDARNWVYDFERDLLPGMACTFTPVAGFKSVAGNAIKSAPQYKFQTGGPTVMRTEPYSGSTIDEDQTFYLYLNGPAKFATVQAHAWCQAEQIAQKIPVTLIEGKERDELLARITPQGTAAQPGKLSQDLQSIVTLRCAQRLGAGAKMSLVWGAGIETLSGVATSKPQSLNYKVREQFIVSFTCERENANAACNPIQPIRLNFNGQVPRKIADQIRLKTPDGERKPSWTRDDGEGDATGVQFKGPFPEEAEITVTLAADFADDLGRKPVNASLFPLKSKTAAFPPLVKFTGSFGILERNAEPVLPLTVRNVEATLNARTASQQEATANNPKTAGLPAKDRLIRDDAGVLDLMGRLARGDEYTQREVSWLGQVKDQPGVKSFTIPKPNGERAFEVVGIPMTTPGVHLIEVESARLGASLLGKTAPMYVRTGVLVTNLAVHMKLGQERSAAWVTALDSGKPVAGVALRLIDCMGTEVWTGQTDASGAAIINKPTPNQSECGDKRVNAYLLSARLADDYSFALSSWSNGIESWRFKINTSNWRYGNGEGVTENNIVSHAIFDRTLLRAGEKVSMKLIMRQESLAGLQYLPPAQLATRAKIAHLGSDESITVPLKFNARGVATASWEIPKEAKLGTYSVTLQRAPQGNAAGAARAGANANAEAEQEDNNLRSWGAGNFTVAEFRLPVFAGAITAPKAPQIATKEVPLTLALNYLNGGPAAGQAVSLSTQIRPRSIDFPDFAGFSFAAPREDQLIESEGTGERLSGNANRIEKLLVDKAALKLNDTGIVTFAVKDVPKIVLPHELRSEMTFRDPNGETQTISAVTALWPAGVTLGIQTEEWAQVKKRSNVQVVALGIDGKPLAGVKIAVKGQSRQTFSHRKRTVGGFYAYDNKTEIKNLGELCSGTSDVRGLLLCGIEVQESGNVELVAQAQDGSGNAASTATSIWVQGGGEWWFAQDNADRMDVLPEKRRYAVGETAKIQVRSPFREATAWLAIEREGVIETLTVPLSGKDPVLSIPIKAQYAPNVYISVLAVRGRLREVKWYSIFTWGWRAPVAWYQEWQEWRQYEKENDGRVTTAMVDLAKPAFKYGLTEVQVGTEGYKLAVSVKPERDTYQTREVAKVKVKVTLPDGKAPPAGSEVAFAAVDQALLELQANGSWELLDQLIQRRSYGVETATAQMQVIGKRHFGKKALPPGGGGGRNSSRELFDTLLVWLPAVKLDANGEATVDVPLNDSLTSFKLVAVADVDTSLFGTGSALIRATKDLQLISGLPPLVREGDRFRAGFTVRNTTARAMQVRVEAEAKGVEKPLAPQTISLAANSAQEVEWDTVVPDAQVALEWQIKAAEIGGAQPAKLANDAMKLTQKIVPAVPLTVQQATLQQLDKTMSLALTQPPDAMPGRGRIVVGVSPKLTGSMGAVQRYFEQYPFICLEQKTSKAIGMDSEELWSIVAKIMPNYLDSDGLAKYFPTESGQGYDSLTAYILSAAHEAGKTIEPDVKARMEAGLIAFVEGRIERKFWSPRADLEVRKLAALEALSRGGADGALVRPALLQSITINPNVWPTGAVIDWLSILKRVKTLPQRAEHLAQAEQVLRARLNMSGTRMGFSTEEGDYWWWLMVSGDSNAAKLIATVADLPGWKEDVPRLVIGMVARQQRGVWGTTTANLWGQLALKRFSARFENEQISGQTSAGFDEGGVLKNGAIHDWAKGGTGGANATSGKLDLPYAFARDTNLRVTHEGSGKPWLTIQSLAAVVQKAPFAAGYSVTKTWTPIEQKTKGAYTRGDLWRVKVEVSAQADYTWVVVNDPIPAGATILGSGLQRDSALATENERKTGNAWLAFEERSFEAFRAYYEYAPKGKFSTEYTIRLNQDGSFSLPPTRVEAMYAPEQFGVLPNPKIEIVK